MNTIAPDMLLSSPLVALAAGAMTLLLLEVFAPAGWSKPYVCSLFLILAFAALLSNASSVAPQATIFAGALFADPLYFFAALFALLGAFLVVLLSAGRPDDPALEQPVEFYSLLLFSTLGAVIFSSAAELMSLFIGLELMSLSLYCLCASSRLNCGSTEAALKYFILGSYSSAILLFGIALIYGLTASTSILEIAADVSQIDAPLLYFAATLFIVGVIFKIGGVPFHFWVPDVYEGAPTAVAAYMASVVKGASIIAGIRILYCAFGDLQFYWASAVWLIALLSIVGGNLMAIRQDNVKRMLAYSSIAHAGYMLIAFLGLQEGDDAEAAAAVLYYIAAYGIASIGTFGVVHALGAFVENQKGTDHITAFRGLAKQRPMLAFMMLLFLFSLAGLPPGMMGLLGKVYVFYSAVQTGHVGITVVAVLGSAVSLYYYLRIVVQMYFLPPEGEFLQGNPGRSLYLALIVCALAVVLLGVFPSGLHDFAAAVGESL